MANVRQRIYDPWSAMVADSDPGVELSIAAVHDSADPAKVKVAASIKAATTYTWDDGSSNTVSGASGKTTHTYAYNGTYEITGTQGALSGTQSIVIDAPTAVPGAPTAVAGTGGHLETDLEWVAPASDGRSPITGYKVEKAPGPGYSTWTNVSADTGSDEVTLEGVVLTEGNWKFRVSAINAVGTGAASTASDVVVVEALVAPDAPTGVAGTGGILLADLTWVAPTDDGGSAITGYKIEKAPGPAFDTWSTAVADTGTDDVAYDDLVLTDGDWKFRVSAINAIGTSTASDASATVTVTAA